jgi:hypothetical protein
VQRCSAYEDKPGAGPKHLEGGFYDLRSLGPHIWICKARADVKVVMGCRCGHKGQPQWLCNGHRAMIARRASGVCPACVHPPAEVELQARMERIRLDPANYRAADATTLARNQERSVSQLWDIQAELNELVERGIVHRCGLTMTEVS